MVSMDVLCCAVLCSHVLSYTIEESQSHLRIRLVCWAGPSASQGSSALEPTSKPNQRMMQVTMRDTEAERTNG
jgi:hypothetical protein